MKRSDLFTHRTPSPTLPQRWRRNTDAATAIEYSLIAAGIALAIAVIVFTMGDSVKGLFDFALTAFTSH